MFSTDRCTSSEPESVSRSEGGGVACADLADAGEQRELVAEEEEDAEGEEEDSPQRSRRATEEGGEEEGGAEGEEAPVRPPTSRIVARDRARASAASSMGVMRERRKSIHAALRARSDARM